MNTINLSRQLSLILNLFLYEFIRIFLMNKIVLIESNLERCEGGRKIRIQEREHEVERTSKQAKKQKDEEMKTTTKEKISNRFMCSRENTDLKSKPFIRILIEQQYMNF